jgi:pimeloyl-ACP methyl ester carboxylesterase
MAPPGPKVSSDSPPFAVVCVPKRSRKHAMCGYANLATVFGNDGRRRPSRARRHRMSLIHRYASKPLGLFLLALSIVALSASSAAAQATKPTIVLVHGGWADASSWNRVAARLQRDGYTVIAPANPLRGVKPDSEYLKSVLSSISGPVVLASHSYGGYMTTDAATGDPNVKALVYIAAFAPEEGETLSEVLARNPGSEVGGANLTLRPYPGGTDVYINPVDSHRVFCADLPARKAALMAATQRPIAAAALAEPSSVPAWKTIPSWYMVASQDHAIPPATERFMANRAHAVTVEVNSSHVAMLSHPEATTRLILAAARATS